jgi:hypothetical protein
MSTASINFPENAPDELHDYRWVVPTSRDPRWPGEVYLRETDGAISVVNMGFVLDTPTDARNLAAALLAAADQVDAGVTFRSPQEKYGADR